MTAFAQDVAAVVGAVGAKDVILVGHSMGGPVAIEAAKLLGDRVIGIVGVDAFYTPLAAVPEEMKLKFIEMLKADYPAALRGTVNSMFTQNASQDLLDATYADMLADNHAMGVQRALRMHPMEFEKRAAGAAHLLGPCCTTSTPRPRAMKNACTRASS